MCIPGLSRNFSRKFISLLDQLELTPFQKETIKSRYVAEVRDMEIDYLRSTILFIGLTNLVTIAGILVTSFTTLAKALSLDSYWQNALTWSVWALSLSLTLANGWLQTFGIYKKYVLTDVTLQKMYNEGWSFIAGVNRYEKLTLDERFDKFCSKIEQIITNTTIKQLSDNTAGINVHDVLEVPQDGRTNTVSDNTVGTVNMSTLPDNIAHSPDTVLSMPADTASYSSDTIRPTDTTTVQPTHSSNITQPTDIPTPKNRKRAKKIIPRH